MVKDISGTESKIFSIVNILFHRARRIRFFLGQRIWRALLTFLDAQFSSVLIFYVFSSEGKSF